LHPELGAEQIATGFLMSMDPKCEVQSAGTAPAPKINPNAVAL